MVNMYQFEHPAGYLESWDELDVLFTEDYWNMSESIPAIPYDAKPALSTSERKMTASTFEKGVAEAMNQRITGVELPQGVLLDIDRYPVGSLLLLDLETVRQGVAPASGAELNYDLNYPGQVRRILNADAADLISLNTARRLDEDFRPARFKLHNSRSQWQYSRVAWFAMVAPTEDKGVNSLHSYSRAAKGSHTKSLFQEPFGIERELLADAVIGASMRAVVQDNMGKKVQQYQRLRSATYFEQPSQWLSKEVYKKHYSAKILGRRAVKNLSGACLVRDTE